MTGTDYIVCLGKRVLKRNLKNSCRMKQSVLAVSLPAGDSPPEEPLGSSSQVGQRFMPGLWEKAFNACLQGANRLFLGKEV